MSAKSVSVVGISLIFIAVSDSYRLDSIKMIPPYFRLIFDLIMHLVEYIMHTSGFSKLRRHFVCVLFFSLGSVQLHFIIHILGSGRLGSSCPVNWKQSSFVGLLSVHIDDNSIVSY